MRKKLANIPIFFLKIILRQAQGLRVFFIFLLITSILIVPTVRAELVSQHYVIYENVMHTFDGPVISNVAASVSGNSATVTWTTDQPSDSYVEYAADASMANSKEQGNSTNLVTSHSFTARGLDYATTYFYRAKSKRVNGGISTSAIGTFSIGAAPPVASSTPTQAFSGGGMLIIDKTDKIPPELSNVKLGAVTEDTAEMTWTTNEPATSFLEFGTSLSYGNVYGEWSSSTAHRVILKNLKSGTSYQVRAMSSDSWANVGYSKNLQFKTLGQATTPEEATSTKPNAPVETLDKLTLEQASQRLLDLIKKMSGQVSLNRLEPVLSNQLDAIKQISGIVPAPILSGEPKVEAGATKATISWITDKDSSSQVAIAPESEYKPAFKEPYGQIVGDAETLTQYHQVKIFNLTPNTLYHFQLRSKASLGPMAVSRDFTFRTILEGLQITGFFSQRIDDNSAVFKWVTNKEADSSLTFTPYHGDNLAISEAKTVKDNTKAIIHEITIKEFSPGVIYKIEAVSDDGQGHVARETIDKFSTSDKDLPPEISQIKTDSTIFTSNNKVQTIISWLTNEPATTQVYYMEGVQAADKELTSKTDVTTDYTKEHVLVMSTFKPGMVYSFRVESVDSGNNKTTSKLFTFMTPKKSESIIDIIIRILEDTFGWTKKLMR